MPDQESSASVALEEGAEPTPAESPTASEGSSAEKDGAEPKPGETPPVEGKSSQEPPSPDVPEDKEPAKGKDVPYGQYTRVKEDRDKLRGLRDQLAEVGIKSKEDAEFLLKDVDKVREEAQLEGRRGTQQWIAEDPARFLSTFRNLEPKAADALDMEIAPHILERVAIGLRESNPELADQIRELAVNFRGNGKQRGDSRPESADTDAIKREKMSIQDERQQTFDEQVESEISTVFRSKLTEHTLTKGLAFSGDEQRDRFYQDISEDASKALDKNPIYKRQNERLQNIRGLSKSEIQDRRKEVVALRLKHSTDPEFLKGLIENEKKILSIPLRQATVKTEARAEVNGSGTPPSGKLTQDAKDRMYSELEKKGFTGSRLSTEYAAALSKAKLGA